MTRQWHVEGPEPAGAATLDAVFQQVMTAHDVRAASVAIASGRTVYAKRAYTWAEPGNPLTTTTTTFRLASVTRLFTAAAVQQARRPRRHRPERLGLRVPWADRGAGPAQGRDHDRAVRHEPERHAARLRAPQHDAARRVARAWGTRRP
ncbi:hypothetical protein GCM10025868_20020 [Angustibacter aerolatus]|uniref:Beta-lactamase-related domain-containing protein n=1 Tax=Angustibacter aerolatus TaxID=1162965 RepID=A0ABQ6JG47_9ACTN|nr:serine hydrolase [Angustibacter aerolatus]GMA86752.1 hypothetical protein GCM10025868_20020 [Angustibacter aerolatus]